MLQRLFLAIIVGLSSQVVVLAVERSPMPFAVSPAMPEGKSPYTVNLASLPDRDLIGKNVDIFYRRMSNHSARRDDLRLVISNVLLLESPEVNEWGAPTRRATFALDAKETRTVRKLENRLGGDLIVRARQPQ
jgi:hypothetical protein